MAKEKVRSIDELPAESDGILKVWKDDGEQTDMAFWSVTMKAWRNKDGFPIVPKYWEKTKKNSIGKPDEHKV